MKLKTLIRPAQLVRTEPYNLLIEAAQKAKSQSQWGEAAALYEEAFALRESFGVMVQMGHMNKEAGELEKAEEAYFKALEMKPDDADLSLQIGHFFYVKGDLAQSVEFYRKALALDPENPSYQHNLKIGERRLYEAPFKDTLEAALKALQLRQWTEAEAGFRAVIDAGNLDYVHLLGHAVKEQGKIVEAIEHYRAHYEYVKDKPGPIASEAAELVGEAMRTAGHYSEAAVWLMRARELRMAREGWVGSVDAILNDVEKSLKRVYPCLDAAFIR